MNTDRHLIKGKRLRMAVRGWSMRRKMMMAFAVPVILVSLVIYLLSTLYLQKKTEQQLRHGTEQALVQAGSFTSSYLQNMQYISDTISGNADLIRLMESPDFGTTLTLHGNYLEFYQLNEIFQRIEFSNGEYRIGMYVPDTELYSNNNFYFYPVSELKSRADYREIEAELETGRSVYRILLDKRMGNSASEQPYLARLGRMQITEADGTRCSYITKVEIRRSLLEQMLRNAMPTAHSLVYLLDGGGQYICSSSEEAVGEINAADFPQKQAKSWETVQLGTEQYYAIQYSEDSFGWTVGALIPVREYRHQFLWLLILFVLLTGMTIAAVSASAYLLAKYYTGRICLLNNKMSEIQSGDINLKIGMKQEKLSRDEMDELYCNFDFMMGELQKLMKEQYRLGRSISQTEMKALQAQINPHFLYNTLDLINWGAMDYGADEVAELARNLGQFYRLSLNHGRSAISIRDELRHIKSFVDIENVHYDHAIFLHIDVPEEIQNLACLNITLQPFVENSVLHGMGEHSEIRGCRIEIGGRREGNDIILTVRDDGPGVAEELARQLESRSPGSGKKGYGITNVNFRIKLTYGEEYGVTYSPGKEGGQRRGTTVMIRIKAMTMEELEEAVRM